MAIFALLAAGCSSAPTGRVAQQTYAAQYQGWHEGVKILKSQFWCVRNLEGLEIEYRIIYAVRSKEPVSIVATYTLKNAGNQVLGCKQMEFTRAGGIYPVSFVFEVVPPLKSKRSDWYVIEVEITSMFGVQKDNRRFSLVPTVFRKPGDQDRRSEMYAYLGLARSVCHPGSIPVYFDRKRFDNRIEETVIECVRRTALLKSPPQHPL